LEQTPNHRLGDITRKSGCLFEQAQDRTAAPSGNLGSATAFICVRRQIIGRDLWGLDCGERLDLGSGAEL